jgi:hypothetical protein
LELEIKFEKVSSGGSEDRELIVNEIATGIENN